MSEAKVMERIHSVDDGVEGFLPLRDEEGIYGVGGERASCGG